MAEGVATCKCISGDIGFSQYINPIMTVGNCNARVFSIHFSVGPKDRYMGSDLVLCQVVQH